MISDRKQYIGIKNNIVFELFQFLFMLEWFLACISRFSAHIPTSFSVFMPNICCLDKLDNKHYAYRLIMMWEYGQKNEKYWPGSIPAHIRIGKVLNVVIFDTNNCLLFKPYFFVLSFFRTCRRLSSITDFYDPDPKPPSSLQGEILLLSFFHDFLT